MLSTVYSLMLRRTLDSSECFLLREGHLKLSSDLLSFTAGVAVKFVHSGCDAFAYMADPFSCRRLHAGSAFE